MSALADDMLRKLALTRPAAAAATAVVYFLAGLFLVALGVWDIYADWRLEGEPLWTTMVENAVTLSVGATVFGVGAWIFGRHHWTELAALAEWTLVAVAFAVIVTGVVLGAQALQTSWKPWIIYANFVGTVLLGGFATGRFASRLRQEERKLAEANRELRAYAREVERLSVTDQLTQLPNRRRFDQFMAHHAELAARYGEPLVVMIIDLDRFKDLNDRHGHQVGDRVLRDVAAALSEPVRSTDIVARWGGEEFAILAPKTDRDGGLELAERLRQGVAALTALDGNGAVTVSIGLAERASGESPEALIARADAALYRAKQTGRNRIVCARPDEAADEPGA